MAHPSSMKDERFRRLCFCHICLRKPTCAASMPGQQLLPHITACLNMLVADLFVVVPESKGPVIQLRAGVNRAAFIGISRLCKA